MSDSATIISPITSTADQLDTDAQRADANRPDNAKSDGVKKPSAWSNTSQLQSKLIAAEQTEQAQYPALPSPSERIVKPVVRQLPKPQAARPTTIIIAPPSTDVETKQQSPLLAQSSLKPPSANAAASPVAPHWGNSPAGQVRRGKNLWHQPSPLTRDRSVKLNSLKALPIQPSPHYVSRDLMDMYTYQLDEDISRPSPGPSIRRLAEQFLSSLPDDSPSTRGRQLNNTQHNNALNKLSNLSINDGSAGRSGDAGVSEQAMTDEQKMQQLHTDIQSFTQLCTMEQNKASSVRQKLIQQTRNAIQTIWPTAVVDVVGSVQCSIALPRSDLDFVVTFEPTAHAPTCYTYVNNAKQVCNDDVFYTKPDEPATDSGKTQYFVHAGSLLKLIGGRKKSKVLFQSTKIQVFKDINLIRLRCGWTGISIDIWFPSTSQTLQRSQLHCKLIDKALKEQEELYTLSCVVKSFMSQQNLNSGYSGLNTFGIELMLIHWLQHRRHTVKADENTSPISYGQLLYDFFVYFIQFDYVNSSIDVNNTDGSVATKPELRILSQNKSSQPASSLNDSDSDIAVDTTEGEKQTNEMYTLCIHDPYDTTNYIVCHCKALTNIVVSFIAACRIIQPAETDKITLPTAISTPHNQELLTQYQVHKLSASSVHTSTIFQRLMGITSVLDGPAQKQCMNRACGIMCPTQNKICFQCSYVFVTPASRNSAYTNNRLPVNNRHQRMGMQQYGQQQQSHHQQQPRQMSTRHYYNSQHMGQQQQGLPHQQHVGGAAQPLTYMQLPDGNVVPVMVYTQPNGKSITLYGQAMRADAPQQPMYGAHDMYGAAAMPIQAQAYATGQQYY